MRPRSWTRSAAEVRGRGQARSAALPRTTWLTSSPISEIAMRISSPACSVNGRSGTRDVPSTAARPAGNSSSRNRNAASSVHGPAQARRAGLAGPGGPAVPADGHLDGEPVRVGTSQAGRIPGPAAQPPR